MMSLKRILLIVLAGLLFGCGGGSGSSSVPPPTTPIPTAPDTSIDGFADMAVPAQFDWQMQSQSKTTLKLVSNFSYNSFNSSSFNYSASAQADGLPLSGQHIVKVFGIDQDNNVLTTPVFTGMTNEFGELPITFNIPEHWLGIVVGVQLDESTCSQTFLKAEITGLIALGCDVVVSSDL